MLQITETVAIFNSMIVEKSNNIIVKTNPFENKSFMTDNF